ncbi:hypothetical protein GQ42DRAFT_79684 [Ramicandelaber brevisporus]|nr:hypothetical protein GQ42DRAFT_79684 [Ramicandelaber brevisporus]
MLCCVALCCVALCCVALRCAAMHCAVLAAAGVHIHRHSPIRQWCRWFQATVAAAAPAAAAGYPPIHQSHQEPAKGQPGATARFDTAVWKSLSSLLPSLLLPLLLSPLLSLLLPPPRSLSLLLPPSLSWYNLCNDDTIAVSGASFFCFCFCFCLFFFPVCSPRSPFSFSFLPCRPVYPTFHCPSSSVGRALPFWKCFVFSIPGGRRSRKQRYTAITDDAAAPFASKIS